MKNQDNIENVELKKGHIHDGYKFYDEDIKYWKLILVGPQGTPYEGGRFFIDMIFEKDYPIKPPKLTFKNKIYHPLVNTSTNKVCGYCITHKN